MLIFSVKKLLYDCVIVYVCIYKHDKTYNFAGLDLCTEGLEHVKCLYISLKAYMLEWWFGRIIDD